MIPRERPKLAPEAEKPVVEMEEVEVTDWDFYFQGGEPLMVTLFPGDVLTPGDTLLSIAWASGMRTVVHLRNLLYSECRLRTFQRPKKEAHGRDQASRGVVAGGV